MCKAIRLLIPLAMVTPLRAAVVYQNTASPTGVNNVLLAAGEANSPEHANRVELSGTERIVTGVTVHLRIMGAGVASFNRELRLYRHEHADDQPGELLWASGPIFTVIDSGAPIPYSFAVPNVVVGNSVTWSIQVTNRQANQATLGPPEYNPPQIGHAPFGYWRRIGPGVDDWEFTGEGEAPFGARVDAAPCPTPRNGDLDGNGMADGNDIQEFMTAVLSASSSVAHVCAADFNGNGLIDVEDATGLVAALLTSA